MTERTEAKGSQATGGAILSSSIKGAGYLFLLQLSSRLATFTLNNFVQRVSSIQTVGIASDLELLFGTVLFLSRENLRMTLLRNAEEKSSLNSSTDALEGTKDKRPLDGKDRSGGSSVIHKTGNHESNGRLDPNDIQRQKLVNLSYLPIVAGLILVAVFIAYHETMPDHKRPMRALRIYLWAAMVELCSEPLYLLVQSSFMYDVRAKVEGTALLLRCIVTFGLTFLPCASSVGLPKSECGAEAYAWGQFAYAASLIIGYVGALRKRQISSVPHNKSGILSLLQILRPRAIVDIANDRAYYFDPYLVSVAWSFTAQSALKYVLTEGDRILLMWMGRNNDEKGAYKLISDLGSLIARIVFQPIEEAARAFFSRTLTSVNAPPSQWKEALMTSIDLLSTLLRFHIFLGTYFIFFAPNYSGTLIDILYGKDKSAIPEIVTALSIYCLYVPVMGINGITEGFVQGVGNSDTLRKQSYWMIFCSTVFASVAYVTLNIFNMGSGALVLANMANLGMRIWFCWGFLRKYFRQDALPSLPADVKDDVRKAFNETMSLPSLLPRSFTVYVALVASWIATYLYSRWYGWETWRVKLGHIAIGGICALGVTALMYIRERDRLFGKLRRYYNLSREKKDV